MVKSFIDAFIFSSQTLTTANRQASAFLLRINGRYNQGFVRIVQVVQPLRSVRREG